MQTLLNNICHAQRWAKTHLEKPITETQVNALSIKSVKFMKLKKTIISEPKDEQYQVLKKQYLLYVKFFPFADYKDQNKLLSEMMRIKIQLGKIESEESVILYTRIDTRKSNLNNAFNGNDILV